MNIAAVAVSAADLSRAVAFYELLGFRFPALEDETLHVEADGDVRLMIDDAAFLTRLHGEAPRPGNTAGFAVLFDSPADVDAAASRVADAGHAVVTGALRRAVGPAVRHRCRSGRVPHRPVRPATGRLVH